MEAIIIILLIVLIGFSFTAWRKGRSENRPVDDVLLTRISSVQRCTDESLMRIKRLEERTKTPAEKTEENDVVRKPLNTESVRIALRYNGFSPETSGTDLDDWETVRFKVEDTFFRIDTSHLPFLTLELGFRMAKEEDVDLMYRAAREVTAGIFLGKVNILRGEDESAVVFQAEFIADGYLYFRDNFKEYLNIVIETHKRFFDTYNNLKEEKKKELDQVDRMMNRVRSGADQKKVLS